MSILEDIITKNSERVAKYASETHTINLHNTAVFTNNTNNNPFRLIAEIKRASPSKGMIDENVDVVAQAKRYEALGASAISVLCEPYYFKGDFADLIAIRKAVKLPLLCKDFVTTSAHLLKAKSAGANIVLLIVAALSPEKLQSLYHFARELALDVLVEVHDENELEQALSLNPQMIGINNRSLKTFAVDLATTQRLKTLIPDNITVISESGMLSPADILEIKAVGVDGVLIGEGMMRQADVLKEVF